MDNGKGRREMEVGGYGEEGVEGGEGGGEEWG